MRPASRENGNRNFAYYTLRVGGDHFEYRVYAHLVPLAFASFA